MGFIVSWCSAVMALERLGVVFLSLAALSIKSPAVVFRGGLDQGQKPSSAIETNAAYGRLWLSLYQGIL
jgi:hypothetical protein